MQIVWIFRQKKQVRPWDSIPSNEEYYVPFSVANSMEDLRKVAIVRDSFVVQCFYIFSFTVLVQHISMLVHTQLTNVRAKFG